MRKVLLISLMLCFIATVIYGAMIKTEGERKVVNHIRQIYNTLESSGQSVLNSHNKAKDYVTNNPTQIDANDKTILINLQTLLNDWQTSKQSALDYIKTNIPGIDE